MRIEEEIIRCLQQQKKTLSLAESCSGGLLANRLTNIPGSSEVLKLGLIAYSNESKIKLLHVPSQIIKKHGAVSEQVAYLMAQNVRKILKNNFGISITGIAGPSGGTITKPVGLVFIAVCDGKKTLAKKYLFKGNRLQIKLQTAEKAMEILWEWLDEGDRI